MTHTLLDSTEIRLLTEVGYLTAANVDTQRAEVIFGALELLRPQGVYGYAGLAFAYLNAALYDQCVAVLDTGLHRVTASDAGVLHAIRALALKWAGRSSESERAADAAGNHPLAEMLRHSSDPIYKDS